MSGAGEGPTDVGVRGGAIRLGQFLKLCGACDSGAEAKLLLSSGTVTVNGDTEERRGRQLREGDLVSVEGRVLRVAADRQL